MNEPRKGAMLQLPASCIRDVDALLAMLKLPNPAYAAKKHMSYGGDKIPEFLTFFKTNPFLRTITVPRNISPELYSGTPQDHSTPGKPVLFSLNPAFKLRPYQQAYFQAKLQPVISAGGTDLNLQMPCGHGKTMVALFLAMLRSTNVVVGVTTHALAKQWVKAAKFMFPNNTVSVYEPDRKSYEFTDIVISTYNMLGSERCGNEFFSLFGHAIFDEVHRAAAKEFLPAIEKASCSYRTTLSATFRRKDGLHEVLKWHCGPSQVLRRQTPGAAVVPIRTGVSVDMDAMRVVDKRQTKPEELGYLEDMVLLMHDGEERHARIVDFRYGMLPEEELLRNNKGPREILEVTVMYPDRSRETFTPPFPRFYSKGSLSSARIKSEVADSEERRQLLLELISDCHARGRNTLVLSARKDMLYALSDRLYKEYFIPNGVIASHKSKSQREYCQLHNMTPEHQEQYCVEEAPVILGIDKLAEEGFDVERLDTLIIAHPIRDIEQAVGRILRLYKGKRDPMVFYLIDSIPTSRAIWKDACEQFKELENRVLPEVDLQTFRARFVNSQPIQ